MEGNDFWIYDAFRRRCIARGFCPKIITETGDISFSHKLCSMKQGLGITVDFIADFIKTPGVRAIPLDDPSFLWKVFLVYHKKKILSPAARELCRFPERTRRDRKLLTGVKELMICLEHGLCYDKCRKWIYQNSDHFFRRFF